MDESDQSSENNDGISRPPHVKETYVRSKSPTPTRFLSSHTTGTSTTSASTPQRTVSSEKRRSTISPWVLSSAAVHGVGMVAKKVVNNRLTESLWHSKKGAPSALVSSDASFDHTSKPSLNVADEQTAKLPVSSKPTHEREKTPLRGKNVDDQSENSKPLDGSHGRLVNQHRWPNPTGSNVIDQSENLKSPYESHVGTTGPKVIDQSENLKPPDDLHVNTKVRPPDDSHVRLVNEQKRQSTSCSNVIDQLENLKPPDSPHVHKTGSDVIDPSESLKPPDGSHDRLVNQHRWPSTTGSNVINQSENPKPLNSSHGRLVNQHRWPGTTGSNVIDQLGNSKHPDGSHVRLLNQHRWHGTTGSNVIHHSKSPDGSYVKRVTQHRWPSTTGSNVIDQLENSKPLDDLHVKLVNQHRWPGTIGSNALNKNSNPSNEAIKTCITPQLEPSSPTNSYRFTSEGVSPSRTRASTPAPAKEVSSSLTTTGVSPSPAFKRASLAPSKGVSHSRRVRGVSLTPTPRAVSHTPATRGVSLTPISKKVDPPTATREVGQSLASKESDISLAVKEVVIKPSLVTRGVNPSLAMREVDPSTTARVIYPIPTVRGTSPMPHERDVSSTPTNKPDCLQNDNHSLITSSSPRQSCNSNTISFTVEIDHSSAKETSLTPTRGASPTPRRVSHSLTTTGISPTPIVRGASPTPTKGHGPRTRGVSPTPTRHTSSKQFFHSNLFSIFSKITNMKKEKNVSNHKEYAKYLELLQNIQVQWQFVNASAEATLDLQRVNAEKSLFDMWSTIIELRDSIATKKIDIGLLILQLKLYAILYRQMSCIDEWALIERDHEYALSITTNDLQVKSLRLPIIGGVKADIKALKLAVSTSVEVMQTTLSSIQTTLSKLDKTHLLASELANVALHERALLDECEMFLVSAAPLQVKECSLRSHLIQSNQTCNSE